MKFIATADTDIGNVKDTNQDSVLVKHADSAKGEVLMAVVCDGMGGLSKGELASATVIRAFAKWFDEELSLELEGLDMNIIGAKWELMLKSLNSQIIEYSKSRNLAGVGTTFSGILFAQGRFMLCHVGDSRIYRIDESNIYQLTEDQTFVAREVRNGNMTPEQAKTDRRRNLLLQCVGASRTVEPQIICGHSAPGAYMLCSDGFRHEISDEEIHAAFDPRKLGNKEIMKNNIRYLIDLVKSRKERDNISAVLIKAE